MKKYLLILVFVWVFLSLVSPVDAVNKSSIPPLFKKALNESREGNFLQALKTWDEFLVSFPDDAVAISNRGNVRLALGDAEGAILDQTRAVELLPLAIDPHVNRGIAEESIGELKKAIDDYKWVLEKEPQNALALYNLGNVRGSQGDWLEAKILFNKASFASPSLVMARSSRALACYQLREFDEAEKELRLLIKKYPMFADGRAALSALLWREGFSGEAESHWAAAAGLDSRYSQADWLLNVRRWPPQPIEDLMAFLNLETI
ncbi:MULTISPECIES: tetratricopeptide repeat protein [Prochlorococcus]|uniref:Secreted TPR repeats protein n=1 Tax=Prochlorococcus marinus (strain SARG / CCMP1375 / SS120) TaxID=167539 RepID=Q7V9Q5_PROMA|nr:MULTISPECIES: tetratricopeptide repeat protein [Prochlorococcus]AAQ00818.1 Secreted TPR repeats protein [Prochlorococcus marinus subsp. marinus str. CCMP1375]KGG10687.1 TPR repeat precursor [Prochlorococcus marinus str. LG]KGG21108.1 TPR repeat precursor [Prochlorococcus marinus str. SS2]KGG23933.1 TPR repeat precursor [Prochlorococcus marinus str. SS35]KGG31807.1 TPR repeat precursor [Prochlorococcus marinus str. SS51]